jgi:hypothetical protein
MSVSPESPLPGPVAPILTPCPLDNSEDFDLGAESLSSPRSLTFDVNLGQIDPTLMPKGLPGIPDISLDVGQLVVSDAHLHASRALTRTESDRLPPGHSFSDVFERRLQDFSLGDKGVSIVGGTQFAPGREVEASLKHFFAELFSALQERDIGISNGGGAGPGMHWASEIYRTVRESRNPESRGKICQVLCEIEPPNGFGDADYIVRPQRNITARFDMVKALGPCDVIETPGRVGTVCEIYATLMENAFCRLQKGQDSAVTPIVLLGYGPDQKNEWWDWVDSMFKQMDETMQGAKKKYTIADTLYYVDFKDTKGAVESVLAMIEGKGEKPPHKFDFV